MSYEIWSGIAMGIKIVSSLLVVVSLLVAFARFWGRLTVNAQAVVGISLVYIVFSGLVGAVIVGILHEVVGKSLEYSIASASGFWFILTIVFILGIFAKELK